MAQTRATTGNSRPRKADFVTTTTTNQKTARKPRAGTGAGVKKTKKAPVKRKAGVNAKVEGAVEKAKGVLEGRPGKKVRAVFADGKVAGRGRVSRMEV